MSPDGLGVVDPRDLTATRIALHHAAILVSAVGRSFGAHQPGSHHAALFVDRATPALGGWPLVSPTGRELRASLRFDPATILVADETIPLGGTRFPEAVDRVRGALARTGLDASRLSLRLPSDLSPGPIQTSGPFAIDDRAAAALGGWFALADAHLSDAATANAIALRVPCWPDHFDLALVVPLTDPGMPDGAQVTLGFSPGDATIDEPYAYVLPWPLPPRRVAEIPAPAGGRWHVEGWQGLALHATAVLAADDVDATVRAFLERGFELARDLVRAG